MARHEKREAMAINVGFNNNHVFGGFGLNVSFQNMKEEIHVDAPPQPAIANPPPVQAIGPPVANNQQQFKATEPSPVNRNNIQSKVIAFYKNEIPSEPNGDFIENIINNWYGDYEKLDTFNNYIQWLFPSRVPGKNPQAPLLTDEDVEMIKYCKQSVMRAFAMMLDFYGMKLENNTIDLAPNHRERLKKITSHRKYYYVISRILSFLKELGEQKLMITWLKFLADLIQKNLLDEDAKSSFNSYWIKALDKNGFDAVKGYINQINRI